jgi:hypothetical protein
LPKASSALHDRLTNAQEATMLMMLALLALGPCLDAPVMPTPQQSETQAPPRPDQPFPRPPQSCNPPAPPTS